MALGMMPALWGVFTGFVLITVAAVTKSEKWKLAYGVVGLIFTFVGLGFFGFGRLTDSIMPAMALLFGLFSFYTKGNAQLLSILVTMVLIFQIVN
jgi:hypothetical protein